MSENMVSPATVSILMPEILILLTAACVYVGGAFSQSRFGWNWLAAIGLGCAGVGLFAQMSQIDPEVSGPLILDVFSCSVRCVTVLLGLMFVLLSAGDARRGPAPEEIGSVLAVMAGVMLVALSNELVLLFLGLELISIPTYILLFLGRSRTGSDEATAKYFYLSILSSALLLYGFSFLYGLAGSTELVEIRRFFSSADYGPTPGPLETIALLLVLAGLGFKVTAVPFHFYAPDVYQGTTNTNAGLLAVVPKIGGFVALLRIISALVPGLDEVGLPVCIVLAILTMTFGNVVALWQNNVRRLLAYSSIAHSGYMLIGLAVWFAAGSDSVALEHHAGDVAAVLLYLAVYAAATIGTFAALNCLEREPGQVNKIEQLAGLGKSRPAVAVALAVFMFSLAGIPPLAGFWGKSPWMRDGLLAGDILHIMDGRPLHDPREFIRRIRLKDPGDAVHLEVIRAGKRMTFRTVASHCKRRTERVWVPVLFNYTSRKPDRTSWGVLLDVFQTEWKAGKRTTTLFWVLSWTTGEADVLEEIPVPPEGVEP